MLNTATRRIVAVLVFAAFMLCGLNSHAQMLRFSNHKEPAIPEDALLRLGPFYSTVSLSQSAGYRYTRSSGAGTDYIFGEHLGDISQDGSEMPLVSTLTFRNYLILSRHSDIDMSVTMTYERYPFGTQEDAFNLNIADEGMIGDLSSEFEITPFIKGTIYDSAIYRTDYVDTRGITDRYGGSKYRHFENTVGLNLDWLMSQEENLTFSGTRKDVLPQEDEFKNQKGYFYTEGMGYERKLTEYLVFGLRADLAQNIYSDSTNRPGSSTMAYSGTLGCKLTEFTTANASLGYSIGRTDAQQEEVAQDKGTMVGSAGLQTKLSKQLSHSLRASRAQQGGFESSLEIVDSYGYNLAWHGDALSATLFSTLSRIDPNSVTIGGYSDWMSGVNMRYPLLRTVMLDMSSTYAIRTNERKTAAPSATPDTGLIDPVTLESSNDYNTWVSRISTAFEIWQNRGKDATLTFDIYAEHADRTSAAKELDYKRDVLGANLVLAKKF